MIFNVLPRFCELGLSASKAHGFVESGKIVCYTFAKFEHQAFQVGGEVVFVVGSGARKGVDESIMPKLENRAVRVLVLSMVAVGAVVFLFSGGLLAAGTAADVGEISFQKKMLGEGVAAFLLLLLNIIVWRAGRERIQRGSAGWKQIQIGFLLMLMTALLDIIDNLPALKVVTVIAGLDLYTVFKIVEEFVGTIGGLGFLSYGLLRWAPTVSRLAQEIEEREKSERALEESRQNYRKLFEAANDAIIIEDLASGMIVDANQIAASWLGYSFEELVQMEVSRIEGGGAGEGRNLQQHRDQLESAHHVVFETVWRRRDESEFPVEVSSRLIDNDAAGSGTVMSIVRDISERKRVEARFKQMQDGLAKAQEIARLGSWDWNIPADTVVWSDEFYRIFGFIKGDVEASHQAFLNAIHPDSLDHASRALDQSMLQPDTPFNIEFKILRPDGEERMINSQGEVIRDHNDKPVRMTGLVLDVTERKKAEEALEKQQTFMSSILRNAVHLGIVAMDDEKIIQFFNPAAERMFNSTADEMIGRSVIAIHAMYGVNPARFEAGLQKVRQTGEYEFNIDLAPGEEGGLLNARISRIQDDSGNHSGFLLTVQRTGALLETAAYVAEHDGGGS